MRALAIVVGCSVGSAVAAAQRYQDFITPTPLTEGATLVVGFLGGRESWDNHHRGVRKLALKLRAMHLSGVHVETVENTKRAVALALVRNAFDRDRNGQLDDRERASARVIVYGQSFGGAAVVKFARELDTLGVPILLTVQVDSVGRGDAVIPANVARAANLFQRDGFTIRGEREIRAADPHKTTILGTTGSLTAGRRSISRKSRGSSDCCSGPTPKWTLIPRSGAWWKKRFLRPPAGLRNEHRLFVILACAAPVAVVLRRGPSKDVLLVR